MIINECYNKEEKIKKKEEQKKLFLPGNCYLKILEYYSEEKCLYNKNHDFFTWEEFIKKYFDEDITMDIIIFEKDQVFYEISILIKIKLDATIETLPYIYLHKNKYLKNKWLFIDNYVESVKKEGDQILKILEFKNALNILDYKESKCFIYFDAICKLNTKLKFKQMVIKISSIEIFGDTANKNLNIFDFNRSVMNIYTNFKSFMDVSIFK